MMCSTRVISLGDRPSPCGNLGRVVDAIGSREFPSRLAQLLRESCGAAFFSAFRICNDRAAVLATAGAGRPDLLSFAHARRYVDGMHWRHDPALTMAGAVGHQRSTVLVQVDTLHIEDDILKRDFYRPAGVSEKIAINAQRDDSLIVLSLLRTTETGAFTDAAVEQIATQADCLVSLLVRHAALPSEPTILNVLASVAIIEARLLRAAELDSTWRLTTREREVCARILFGIGATGIGLDLGIGNYSVYTYRARAYRRLGVATRHELLRRYLALDTEADAKH